MDISLYPQALVKALRNSWRETVSSPSRSLFLLSFVILASTFTHCWLESVWLVPKAWPVVLFVAGVSVLIVRFHPSARLGALTVLVVTFTLWRYDAALPSLSPPSGADYRGTVSREPVVRAGRVKLAIADVTADGHAARPIQVTARAAPGVREGDDVAWSCLPPLSDRPVLEGFCTADGAVRFVARRSHPFLELRARLRRTVRSMLPEPDASLLLGLLVGDRGGLPPALNADFRATGTSHVLAVSGYNVMLLIDSAIVLFALAGLARRPAAALISMLVVGFVLLAGADPPVLRAGLMGSAGLLAALLGRKANGTNAFLLAAAIMLLADPLALRHDVSFRLSFFAVAGLSAFGTPFERFLGFIPIEAVRTPLAQTLGATLATLPIALHDFGSFAVASPPTNVLIAPLIPFATAAGAIAVLAATVWSPLGLTIAAAVALALRLMRRIVGCWAALLPAWPVKTGFGETVLIYLGLLILWRVLAQDPKHASV